jgi:hypothetical protein
MAKPHGLQRLARHSRSHGHQRARGLSRVSSSHLPRRCARAKALCEHRDCWMGDDSEIVTIAFSMEGLLLGIATTQDGLSRPNNGSRP